VDPGLLGAVCVLLNAYNGDFTLGGLVRDVDVLSVRADPAYVEQEGGWYRVMDVTLPIVVNDMFSQEA
jgi:hypothetical protein